MFVEQRRHLKKVLEKILSQRSAGKNAMSQERCKNQGALEHIVCER